MQRRQIGREFRIETVRLMRESGVSFAQAPRDPEVYENVLRRWVKAFAADPGQAVAGQGHMKPE